VDLDLEALGLRRIGLADGLDDHVLAGKAVDLLFLAGFLDLGRELEVGVLRAPRAFGLRGLHLGALRFGIGYAFLHHGPHVGEGELAVFLVLVVQHPH
jgi:hypothetical protein